MAMKRVLCVALVLVVLTVPVMGAGIQLPQYAGGATLDGQVPLQGKEDYVPDAYAAFVYDITTDTLIYAYEADKVLYPASLTKLLTALVVLDQGSMSDVITVTGNAINELDADASRAGLEVGESYTTEQLLYCLLLPSGNDAAVVLAQHYGGSIAGFAKLMNEKAARLGCENSHFVNPHGLHDEDQYSTARDLARIFRACLEQEVYMTIAATPEYVMKDAEEEEDRWVIHSTNVFICDYLFDDLLDSRVVAGKTGYTKAAGRCLAVLSRDEGMQLISILLGAPREGEWREGRYNHFLQTRALLNHIYQSCGIATVLEAGDSCGVLLTDDGVGEVEGLAAEGIEAVLPEDYDRGLLTRTVTAAEGLALPIAAGDTVGSVQVWYDGRCVGETALLAAGAVELPTEPPTEPSEEPETQLPAAPSQDITAPVQTQPQAAQPTAPTDELPLQLPVVLAALTVLALLILLLTGERRKKRR